MHGGSVGRSPSAASSDSDGLPGPPLPACGEEPGVAWVPEPLGLWPDPTSCARVSVPVGPFSVWEAWIFFSSNHKTHTFPLHVRLPSGGMLQQASGGTAVTMLCDQRAVSSGHAGQGLGQETPGLCWPSEWGRVWSCAVGKTQAARRGQHHR